MKKEIAGISAALLLTGCGSRGEAAQAYQVVIPPSQGVESNDIQIGASQEIAIHLYTNEWDTQYLSLIQIGEDEEVTSLYSSNETDKRDANGFHDVNITIIPKLGTGSNIYRLRISNTSETQMSISLSYSVNYVSE